MNNSIRKYHFIFLWLMALFLPLQVCAQKGLNVNALFGGHYRKQREVTEVLMKGRQLESYKLTLFRSLTLPVATAHAARVPKPCDRRSRRSSPDVLPTTMWAACSRP